MYRAIIAIIVTGLCVALLAPPARASEDEAAECAALGAARLMREGYRLRSHDSDVLNQGAVMSYDGTFSRGHNYVIFACGDSRAIDLDINLYDEDGQLVARDEQTDNRPVVTVIPRWTGPFRIQVSMYAARGPAHYTLVVMAK
jgi:hypothetical protein